MSAHGRKFHHQPESERRKWQDPEAILGDIGIEQGDVFVDIGCGNGFFSLPAARIVGENGKVYGIDVDEEALDELKKKAQEQGLSNITLMPGEAESVVSCSECADFIFFGIDLHDFRDPVRVLGNALRMIRPTGTLVDLDWKKEPLDIGPPLEIKFSVEKASELIEGAGFIITDVSEPGPMHYMIKAIRAGSSDK